MYTNFLGLTLSSAATFYIQKRMVLKELLSHVLRQCQDQGYIFFFGQDRKYANMKNYSKKQSHGWIFQSYMATTVLLLDACFKVIVIKSMLFT